MHLCHQCALRRGIDFPPVVLYTGPEAQKQHIEDNEGRSYDTYCRSRCARRAHAIGLFSDWHSTFGKQPQGVKRFFVVVSFAASGSRAGLAIKFMMPFLSQLCVV